MKKILFTFTLFIFPLAFVSADTPPAGGLATRLSGKILIQVESHGEAWYVNPGDNKRYFLGRPQDAFALIKKLGIGISDADLSKISPKISTSSADSDNDGYSDETEIKNNYNPFGSGKLNISADFTNKNLGKIFLQTEKIGEAWYIYPGDKKRYFLNKPADAFTIMKTLGLGITNKNIETIPVGLLYNEVSTPNNQAENQNNNDIISAAADAFRKGDKTAVVKYFIPSLTKAIEYTVDSLGPEGRLTLGNILSGSKLESDTATKKVYSNEVYFNGQKIPIHFNVEKIDGVWLMTNL